MPIVRLPEEISFYEYEGEKRTFEGAVKCLPYAYAMHHRLLVAFATAEEIQQLLPAELTVRLRANARLADFLEGALTDPVGPHRRDANAWIVRMLRESFEAHLAARGLLKYDASAGTVMFFPRDMLPDNRVVYTNAKGRQTYKQVVGFSKVLNAHWHLGMRAVLRLGKGATLRLRPYVVFTRDGRVPLEDAAEMTKLRRRFCKSWFNHVWRPLFQAFFEFFGGGEESVKIDLGEHRSWAVAGSGLKLGAVVRMPFDLEVADAETEPGEPDEVLDVEEDDGGEDE